MENTPRAIETSYKGYRFRSRLEARWAVFFDRLGLRFEYEREGFELPSGRYLPDFYLPELLTYIEVKPLLPTLQGALDTFPALTYGDQDKPRLERGGIPITTLEDFGDRDGGIFCVVGQPQEGFVLGFHRGDEREPHHRTVWNGFAECSSCSRLFIWRAQPKVASALEAQRRCPIECKRGAASLSFLNIDWAANEARAARFEFGQSGGPSDWQR